MKHLPLIESLLIVLGTVFLTVAEAAGLLIYILLMFHAARHRDRRSMALYSVLTVVWLLAYFVVFSPIDGFEYCLHVIVTCLYM